MTLSIRRDDRFLTAAFVAAILSACAPPGFAGPGYVFADLGTLGGPDSGAEKLNANGQVVGYADTNHGSTDAFLHSAGKMTDLGTLGGTFGEGVGINSSCQVVGDSYTGAGAAADHAFLYNAGKITDLGTFGGPTSYAFSINNSGQAVGRADLADGSTHAFVYQGGTMTDLGTLGRT